MRLADLGELRSRLVGRTNRGSEPPFEVRDVTAATEGHVQVDILQVEGRRDRAVVLDLDLDWWGFDTTEQLAEHAIIEIVEDLFTRWA